MAEETTYVVGSDGEKNYTVTRCTVDYSSEPTSPKDNQEPENEGEKRQ